jgi:hypothetical protein
MKYLFAGLAFAAVAAAQDPGASPYGAQPAATPAAAYSAPPAVTSAPAAYSPPPYDGSQQQGYQPPAPEQQGSHYTDVMPYQSMVSGGYKSLDCGYGWKKGGDGSCQQEPWVRHFRAILSSPTASLICSPTVHIPGLLRDDYHQQVRPHRFLRVSRNYVINFTDGIFGNSKGSCGGNGYGGGSVSTVTKDHTVTSVSSVAYSNPIGSCSPEIPDLDFDCHVHPDGDRDSTGNQDQDRYRDQD